MDSIVQFLIDWGYIGLFISALLAGSILPFSSEVVLTVLVQMGSDPVTCLIAASIGNTLGGLLCYWLGYLGNMQWIERWLKIDKQKMTRVEGFVSEGIIVLLGLMRCNIYITTVTMFIGKFLRYLLLVLAVEGVNSVL